MLPDCGSVILQAQQWHEQAHKCVIIIPQFRPSTTRVQCDILVELSQAIGKDGSPIILEGANLRKIGSRSGLAQAKRTSVCGWDLRKLLLELDQLKQEVKLCTRIHASCFSSKIRSTK